MSKNKIKTVAKVTNKTILGIILGVFAFLLYANTLGFDFALDDYSVIRENYVVKQGFQGISTIWKTHYRFGYWNSTASLYRPLTLTFFAIEWALSPDNPSIHHFMNVFLYALSGFLLFFVLSKIMKGKIIIPFIASLIFVSLPIHSEVVSNIKSRDEIMGLLFVLGSINFLWNYLNKNNILSLILSLFFFFLGLLSKESVITYLGVVPLLLYFLTDKKIGKIISTTALFIIPTAIFLFIRFKIVGGTGVGESVSILDNFLQGAPDTVTFIASNFIILGKYLLNLILPFWLVHEVGYHQIPYAGFGNWQVIVSILAYLGLIYIAIKGLRTKELSSLGIIFFLMTFSIFSNFFILIGTAYGERLMYFPSIGFSLFLAAALTKLSKMDLGSLDIKSLLKKSGLLLPLLLIIISINAVKTVGRNSAWKNSYTLYETDIKKVPNSAKLNYHFGLELVKKALHLKDNARPTPENKKQYSFLLGKAHKQFEKATKIYPKYGDAYAQIGLSWYRNGDFEKAMPAYKKAIEVKPNNPKALSNMGIIYYEWGDYKEALEVYEKAIQLDPKYVDAHRNIGALQAKFGNFSAAIEHFLIALKYDPKSATICSFLGNAYSDNGQPALSTKYFNMAYELDPSLNPKNKK